MPLLPTAANPVGSSMEPIAIVGFSLELPGGCEDADSFWQALMERRNLATEAPKDRYSAESLFHPDASRRGTIAFRGAHYLTRDISKFDAPFFNISDTEAAALDPQQRGLLETTFRALENAGQIMDRVVGSNTSVFTGCFTDDWKQLSMKDVEQCPSHTGLGASASMLANRLSWFFNFHGASCNLDSACSSSLLGVDLACKSLATGECDMSIAAGSNLVLYPDMLHMLSNLGLLSPDNKSYAFDSRANGYARGEGFGVMVLKRLSDAIADNDCIRAVIRGTGSNQDGYTPNITTPSGKAQTELIRRVYARAGLSLEDTRYVEAHGTGTPTGDPIEIEAIGAAFRKYRSHDDPLYVGAVKSNIGHLEGVSGLAGLIKAVLAVEKGTIPPNTNFEKLNPKIDLDYLPIHLPQEPIRWPSHGLRRASVNSFGFGGSNSHVIVDDAYHYLLAAGLRGNHNTSVDPESPGEEYVHIGENGYVPSPNEDENTETHVRSLSNTPKLVVLSANDEGTLAAQAERHIDFFRHTEETSTLDYTFLNDLLYTLNERRYLFPWRTTALLKGPTDLVHLDSLLANAQRAVEEPALCFVFTGQGAQYPGDQLRALETFKVFRKSLKLSEKYLLEFGCTWRARDELYRPKKSSRINDAEFSQPISTILQIALIDLMRSFGVFPKVVVGHSSGEMAAAYCAGALSARSAVCVAYYRGLHSSRLAASGEHNGAMMAVGLSAVDAQEYVDKHATAFGGPKLTVACINSPKSVTISGDSKEISLLESSLTSKDIFARKLNVNMAYHSPSMQAIAQEYYNSILKLEKGSTSPHPVTMLSSVTGEWIRHESLRDPQYWVDNMVNPVQFSPTVEKMTFQAHKKVWKRVDCSHRNHPKVTFMLEVGFHGALKGPLRDILAKSPDGAKIGYQSLLVRNQPPTETLLASVGQLVSHGCHVNLSAVNSVSNDSMPSPKLLCNLPEYQFNHSKSYWEEGRISKRYRLHPQKKLDLLGKPCPDWNKAEAKWRNFIRLSEMPWVEDHKINGSMIYPGAGMIVMAIEAANQTATVGREVEGFELKDIRFLSSLNIPRTANGIETHLYLREVRDSSNSDVPWTEFRIFAFENEDWVENCRGMIRVQYKAVMDEQNIGSIEKWEELEQCRTRESLIPGNDGTMFDHEKLYSSLRKSGFEFGPSFQLVRRGSFVAKDAKADVELYHWPADNFPQEHVVHPCSLDAILHLTVAAYAEGGRATVPTAVPSGLRKLWIAKEGLSTKTAKTVRTVATITKVDSRGSEYSLSVLDTAGQRVLMRGDGLRSTIVANVDDMSATQSDEEQVCYQLDWKPDASFMTNQQLAAYCEKARSTTPEPHQFTEDLNFIMVAFMARMMNELHDADFMGMQIHHIHYLEWAAEQLSRFRHGALPGAKIAWLELLRDDFYLLEKAHNIASSIELGRIYVDIARQLSKVLTGKTKIDPQIPKALSNSLATHQTGFPVLARFLDVINHQGRDLRMLEIGSEQSARWLEVSELAAFSHVEYKTFDTSREPTEQGFMAARYDLIFAAGIIGDAVNVEAALHNVRGLLKAGGRLIMLESTRPDTLQAMFVPGLFPDQSLSSASMNATTWAMALSMNGFSGIDIEIPDFVHPDCHQRSIMIATAMSATDRMEAIEHTSSDHQSPASIIVADLTSNLQRETADRLKSIDTAGCRTMSLYETANVENLAETSLVFLLELDCAKLIDLSENEYAALQKILTTCKGSLWVTNGGGQTPQTPSIGVANGLFRVLRNEKPDRPYAVLSLDILHGALNDGQIAKLNNVLDRIMHAVNISECDQEYIEVDGILHIPRVQEAPEVSAILHQKTLSHQTVTKTLKESPPLQLRIGAAGFLDSLEFVEDDTYDLPLEPNEVEIDVRASGLNFRDVLIALGRIPESVLGGETAGFVTRVGSPSLGFKPGDRVVALGENLRTYVRADATRVSKIHDKMSFAEAASLPTQYFAAWESVYTIARLQPEESILIHSGAGGTGQAAIQIAQFIGATVYATVGSEAKKQLLMTEYDIPESHIFYSRDTSFAKGVMRMTKGVGVDVIINSLAGESLIASWECIASYGRFVEIGKKDIIQNSNLPMGMFRNNVTFTCFDGYGVCIQRPHVFERTMKKILDLINAGSLRPVHPLNIFPINQAKEAFRAMADGKLAGKLIFEHGGDMEVKTTLRTKPSFTIGRQSTYVVAGGLGGLGRNVARWLVDRGAKNLLLLSRSGTSNPTAREFVRELEDRDVFVLAPPCDVTDFEAMKAVVSQCSQLMPPIRGCVQGSMVLRDATFDKMSYSDWRLGTDCKTIGSWNLHTLLPKDLEFFVMLSSASGVVGLHGQANYAAGNAYLDALTRHRVANGLRATSLDMGALIDDGLLAEDPDFLKRVLSYGALNGISRTYFNAIMDYYCNPSLPINAPIESQPIIGLHTGEESIITSGRPMFSNIASRSSSNSSGSSDQEDWATIFADPSTYDIQHHVTDALIRKLSKTNSSLSGEIDLYKPLVAYGVDSLLAVELRSWLAKEFKADVALFEIQGGIGFDGLARIIVGRSTFARGA